VSHENEFHRLNNLSNLDKKYFEILRKRLFKYKNTLVDVKKLIKDLREEFEISEHLRRMIYECYEDSNE
jgi:hypothetical protein